MPLRTRGGRYTEAAAAASINFTVGYFFKGDNFHGEETFVAPLVAATTRPRWLLRSQSSCYAEYAAAKPIRKMYIFQLYSTPPCGGGASEFRRILGKLDWLGYHMLKKVWWYVKSRFLYRNVTDGRTDRQTDRQNWYMVSSWVSIAVLMSDKNENRWKPTRKKIILICDDIPLTVTLHMHSSVPCEFSAMHVYLPASDISQAATSSEQMPSVLTIS